MPVNSTAVRSESPTAEPAEGPTVNLAIDDLLLKPW